MQNHLDASDNTQRSEICVGLGSHLRNLGYPRPSGVLRKEGTVGEFESLLFNRLPLLRKR